MKAKKLQALSIITPLAIISLPAILAVGLIVSAQPAKANVLYLHDQAA